MNLLLMILAAVVVAFLLAVLIVKFVPLKMRWLISILLLAATAFFVYKIYAGIMEPIHFAKEKEVRYAKVIKNLKLIRDAEVKYKEVYRVYSDNKDSLINFIENGQLALIEIKNIEKEITLSGGLTSKISVKQIDTTGYEPVLKYFKDKDYKGMFNVPGTDKQFQMAIADVEKVTGLFVPVFEVKADKASILKGMSISLVKQELEALETDQIKGAYVSVGSLAEVTTGGNWPPSYDKEKALVEKK